MAADLQSLKTRYNDSCRRQGVLPNKAVLSAIFKAEVRKSRHDECILVVFLDDLKDSDIHPLLDLFVEIDASEVDAVDVLHRSSCVLHGDFVLLLLRAINQKLRVVDLQDLSFGKEFLRDLSKKGLTCHVLNLMSSRFRKLNMIGKFMQLHTLNLDFSVSLTSFQRDCFSCMPKLKCLSLCETRVANLWTASAALVKLSSLVELRFQKCLSCTDTGLSSVSSDVTTFESSDLGYLDSGIYIEASPFEGEEITNQLLNEEEIDMGNCVSSHEVQSTAEESSDDSQVDISHDCQTFSLMELSPDVVTGWNELFDPRNEVPFRTRSRYEGFLPNSSSSRRISYVSPKKYISYHPSPICYEKFYREYMIASLPNLKVLDNLPISKSERDIAHAVYLEHFEYLPYKRKNKESVVSILQKREINANYTCVHPRQKKSSLNTGRSQYFYSRSLSAAKVGSLARPFLHPLSNLGYISRDDQRSFRPRQFEYHPSDSRFMVFGTLDGEVVVVNHESEKVVSYIPSLGAMNSVLGLCWLKRFPSKLIAGSDNGSLKLYDIQSMHSTTASIYCSAGSVTFDEFNQLTSVHANSTDELFVASGYSSDVALYDIGTGRRLQVFSDMHREHINVVKFANHSSSIFATSSFDQDVKMWDLRQKPIQPCYTASSSRGNVMVCFSPDDHYLLVSAVDNEVKQLLAVDGRLHLDLSIASTGSSQNYTRSYYMNGRDYIISGSCDEHVVRICCAQTGRRLRDVSLEGKGSRASMFVQSLRGDPFRDFNMSILAAYMRPSSNLEIVKVNLMASSDCDKECSRSRHSHSLSSMGG